MTQEPAMGQGPIFIGGLGRSGKTWLRFILCSHPNIVMSRRANLWTRHYNRYGDLSQGENLERCLSALLRSKHVQIMRPNLVRIRREFGQGQPTYARLFALLHKHYAQQQSKARWGDQTELLEQCAATVLDAYPDAKMIHLLRDPRDCYAAFMARSAQGKGRAGETAAKWLYSVRLAERNLARYPDRYRVVRYEELVSQPEKVVAELCAFLGEEYSPEMLLMKEVPRFMEISAKGRSPMTADYIGQYRGAVDEREIALMQMMAGRAMLAYGYTPQRLNISWLDWAYVALLEWPASFARTVAWRQRLSEPQSPVQRSPFRRLQTN